jgi:hypothetical protein
LGWQVRDVCGTGLRGTCFKDELCVSKRILDFCEKDGVLGVFGIILILIPSDFALQFPTYAKQAMI